ncbi:MAG: ABC transporter permease [Muribaculaceae bacterium]|nr:ABC transporter permease [Muribaculaceae bacterium]
MKSKIGIIVAREFSERVKKKSFIITTILMPVLMIALMLAPTLVILFSTVEKKEIAVIDNSSIIFKELKSDDELSFITCNMPLDSARKNLTDKFGILYIGNDVIANSNNVKLYTNESSSMTIESNITSQIEKIIETEKLKHYNIKDLDTILNDVKTSVAMQTFRNDGEDKDNATSSITSYGISFILGFFLYMFLLLYGQMVMTSVIEEKNNRVLELMVSSVKPFDLMIGKICGVALVAVTQVIIWGILISAVAGIVIPMLMPADIMTSVAAMNAGTMPAEGMPDNIEMLQALSVVSNIGYIIQLFIYLILFLVGGFLLYAAMFAAVGSAVDNIQDASQLTTPITIPIVIALVLMMTIVNDPNSQLAFWSSMIPFVSPIIMLARIPFGIPAWEIILSLVILYISFIGMVWLTAKIYRVGIFMYGKKPTLKELYKWTRYKS